MNSFRSLLAAFFSFSLLASVSLAADATPEGSWSWQDTRFPGGAADFFLVIKQPDGKWTGTLRAEIPPDDNNGQADFGSYTSRRSTVPKRLFDAEISAVTFDPSTHAFGFVFVKGPNQTFYQGKLEGKTIKGTVTFKEESNRPSKPAPMTRTWHAVRAK